MDTRIYVPSARRSRAYVVRFQWNANPEPNVIGYWLYPTRVSEEYSSDTRVDMTNTTSGVYGIQRPAGLGMWYFALTAYTATAQSAHSTEVSINITNDP